MECPKCGTTDLLTESKRCSQCGCPLQCDLNLLSKEESIARTNAEQGDAGNISSIGEDKLQIEGNTISSIKWKLLILNQRHTTKYTI